MPCHLHIDYEKDDWQGDQFENAPHCAGHAIHLANRCKLENPLRELVEQDYEAVFSTPQQFIDHHSHGEGPQVMLIGSRLI